MNLREGLVKILVNFIRIVETSLPLDIVRAIEGLVNAEEGITKEIATAMLRNIEVAKKFSVPICQDTGVLMFFAKVGLRNSFIYFLGKSLIEAVEVATKEIPLRPNAVNPFTNVNSGINIGRYIPWIEYEVDECSDVIDLWLYIAGGGSSYAGEAKVLNPVNWREQLINFVVEKTLKYGVNACPPLLVGIGIGPTIEIASILSKKALLRNLGKRHEEEHIAILENELRDKLNSFGLGPQGLKGRVLVMDVFIEYSYRHPATCAVAISFGCWVHRKGLLKLYPDLSYEIPTHGIERTRYD
ncbi:MAG: fumarate hydratase [Ignisphaera sp.]